MKHIYSVFASIVLFFRHVFLLIVKPYSGMREISKEKDGVQVGILFLIVLSYFAYSRTIRVGLHPFIVSSTTMQLFLYFIVTFLLVVGYFSKIGELLTKKPVVLSKLIMTFSYSLIPTIMWFFMTSTLYVILPPPRQITSLGKLFTVVFISVSIALLMWRFMLLYLSLRFSLKASFYQILTMIGIFLAWFLPFSYGMYLLNIFRIPFI